MNDWGVNCWFEVLSLILVSYFFLFISSFKSSSSELSSISYFFIMGLLGFDGTKFKFLGFY